MPRLRPRSLKIDSPAMQVVMGLILAALLMLSFTALPYYPNTFEDEGTYASAGRELLESGKFTFPNLVESNPYFPGIATLSRIQPAIFAALSGSIGTSLGAARMVPFFFVLLATVIWFLIARKLGLPGLLGALFFASLEKIFHSSHVFRPEAAMVFANSLFLLIVVSFYGRSEPIGLPFVRGALNGLFVLLHGNGLTTAVLNSIEFVIRPFRRWGFFFERALPYLFGTLLGVAVFYIVQIRDTGGWQTFWHQMHLSPQAHARSLWMSILREFDTRWRDAWLVGNSLVAKPIRFYFYLVILVCSVFAVTRFKKGIERRLAGLALGTQACYTFLVQDKVDLHIAEMMPFYLASFLGWYVYTKRSSNGRRKTLANAVFISLLGTQFMLSTHHMLRYRKPDSIYAIGESVQRHLEKSPDNYRLLVGEMKFWFWLKDRGKFVNFRFVDEYFPLNGKVLSMERYQDLPIFAKYCRREFQQAEGYFTVYDCGTGENSSAKPAF